MINSFRSILLFFALGTSLAACDSGTQTVAPPETTTIIGKIKMYDLGGNVVAPPYDNVTVNLLHTITVNGQAGGYTETALTSGVWAFRKVVYSDYVVYASRPGYGRSEDVEISSQDPKDSTLLTLAEQPHVKPTLDSVLGSWQSGYQFYVHMMPQASERLDILVRPAGSDNSSFSIIVDSSYTIGTYVEQVDSDRYVVYVGKRPVKMPANPEFAAVAYNPAVRYYWVGGNYQWRYCSEGPLSNVKQPQ